ncbi:MAG TPA: hypothetical protein VIK55_03575 [Paludibacter sp.]
MEIIYNTLKEGYDFNISDKWGKEFHFKVLTMQMHFGILSEACEVVTEKGREPYKCSIVNDFDSDIEYCELLLKAKIKKMINVRCLNEGEDGLRINESDMLRGRFEWNDDFSDTKFEYYLVIDGRRITFEKLERLIQPYEGWQIEIKLTEPND